MLSQQVLEAWIQRIEETTSARISGNARDITELAAEAKFAKKGHRVHCEDITEHGQRIEELDEATLGLARYIKALAERIEKLEERED